MSLGTWIAFGTVVLFLAFIAVFLLRTVVLVGLLLLMPAGRVGTWLRARLGQGGGVPGATGADGARRR